MDDKGWTIAGYVLLLILLFLIIILLIVALAESLSTSVPKFEFYTINTTSVPTNRNGETFVDYIAYYRYSSFDVEKFPNPIKIQETIQDSLIAPVGEETTNWGVVNRQIVEEIYDEQNVYGITVQIQFANGQSTIFTKGYIPSSNNQSI
jgi:hypothetical protein